MALDRVVEVEGVNRQVLLPLTGHVWAMFSHGTSSDYTRRCFELYVWTADQAVVGYDSDVGMYEWPAGQDPSGTLIGTTITTADGTVNYGTVVAASLRRQVRVRPQAADAFNACLGEDTPGGVTFNPPAATDDAIDVISVTTDRFTPYEGDDPSEAPAWTFGTTLQVQTAGETRSLWAELGDAISSDVLTFNPADVSSEVSGVRVDAEMIVRYTPDRLILGTASIDGEPHDIVSVVEDTGRGRRRFLRIAARGVPCLTASRGSWRPTGRGSPLGTFTT